MKTFHWKAFSENSFFNQKKMMNIFFDLIKKFYFRTWKCKLICIELTMKPLFNNQFSTCLEFNWKLISKFYYLTNGQFVQSPIQYRQYRLYAWHILFCIKIHWVLLITAVMLSEHIDINSWWWSKIRSLNYIKIVNFKFFKFESILMNSRVFISVL